MSGVGSLFSYMGNKIQIADWIVPMFAPHKKYIEVFGGTFAIGAAKPLSPVEVYNDKNYHLANLFEVIRTNEDMLTKQFSELIVSEPHYKTYYKNHTPVKLGDVGAAVRYLYIMTFCAYGKYNGGFLPKLEPGSTDLIDRKTGIIRRISRRLKNVIVLCRNYDKVIKQCDSDDALFYLDPPYKNTEGYYKELVGDFTVGDHIQLCELLKSMKGKFYLSYESNDFIEQLYQEEVDKGNFFILSKNKHRQGYSKDLRGTSTAEEIVITNYKPQNTLFDLTREI